MDDENKWEKINKLFEYLVTEDNETGRLVCLSCNEDLTDNKYKQSHICSPNEPYPDVIYF